jgi:hypothetical protein
VSISTQDKAFDRTGQGKRLQLTWSSEDATVAAAAAAPPSSAAEEESWRERLLADVFAALLAGLLATAGPPALGVAAVNPAEEAGIDVLPG